MKKRRNMRGLQELLDHIESVGISMQYNANELLNAVEMLQNITDDLNEGRVTVEAARKDVRDIWTSVMHYPYDPEY